MMKKANVIINILVPNRAWRPTKNIAIPRGDNTSAMNKSRSPIIRTVREKLCMSLIERYSMPPATAAMKPTMPQIELQNGGDFN